MNIRSVFVRALALALAFGVPARAHAAATLLPPGEQCFQATAGINGMVGVLGSITGGSGGTNGVYGGISLTGGSGSGATANITVSAGAVTGVTILNPGIQYVVGDVLSAASGNIGSVSGFSVPINSTSINSSLAGGNVTFYVPNTSTFKSTWNSAAQTTQNTNPVQLDQNGCAIIYGTGIYRQVLKDSLGNTVWDQITTDTSANNNTFWAGIAGGTPNVITVTDPGFNATDGSVINFSPLFTNTGATTLNPSGFSAISIVKDTTGGPIALSGGEIVFSGSANVVSVLYNASQNNFHLLNPPIQSASGASAPLCGAQTLKITNGATPNSLISITASQAMMQSNAGLVINRSNVSLANINILTGNTTSAANGMDGEAPGTSAWLYIWLIDNGAAPAGLVTLAAGNGLSPNMPSGYTYKCRVGAMRVDGSGNLFRTLQLGNRAQYTFTTGTNTVVNTMQFVSGSGTGSSCGASSPTWGSVSIAAFVPPVASAVSVSGLINSTSASSTQAFIAVAPNNSYGGVPGTAPPVYASLNSIIGTFGGSAIYSIETANTLYACATVTASTSVSANILGWIDNL